MPLMWVRKQDNHITSVLGHMDLERFVFDFAEYPF